MNLKTALRNPYLQPKNLVDLNDIRFAEYALRELMKTYGDRIIFSVKYAAIVKRRAALLKKDSKNGPTILYKNYYILHAVNDTHARLYDITGVYLGALKNISESKKYIDEITANPFTK